MLIGEGDDFYSAIVSFLRQTNPYKMLYAPKEGYARTQFAFSLPRVYSNIGFVESVSRPLFIKVGWITTDCLKSKLTFFSELQGRMTYLQEERYFFHWDNQNILQ